MFLVYSGTIVLRSKKIFEISAIVFCNNETDVFGKRWRWNVFYPLMRPNSITLYTVLTVAYFPCLKHIATTFTDDKSRLELGINTFVRNIAVRKRYPKTIRDFVAGPNRMRNTAIVHVKTPRFFDRVRLLNLFVLTARKVRRQIWHPESGHESRFSFRFSDSFRVQRLFAVRPRWKRPTSNGNRLAERHGRHISVCMYNAMNICQKNIIFDAHSLSLSHS